MIDPRRVPVGMRLPVLVLWLMLVWLCVSGNASFAAVAGQGHVDQIESDPARQLVTLRGWVASENPAVFVTQLVVSVAGKQVYRGRFERSLRPDVVQASGRDDWLWSGFEVHVPLAPGSAGAPMEVSARLGNGATFVLGGAGLYLPDAGIAGVSTPGLSLRGLAAVGLVALPIVIWLLAWRRTTWRMGRWLGGRDWPVSGVFAAAVLLCWTGWVGLGLTGSSMMQALDGAQGVISHDARVLSGRVQPVRSDEWEVLTPYVISQWNHDPPFPVHNRLIGEAGHNMLVIGMTGVPVAHLSTLAKPATWGFFVFDLRRALAWHWTFAFFACFFVLWAVLWQMFALDWRWAALLAATFAFSPYAVVFSGWPSYAAFFPLAGIALVDRLLREVRIWRAFCMAAAAGMAGAGWILTLYPAWAVSLAYLLLPVGLVWWWSQRCHYRWGAAQWVGLLVALVSFLVLLGSWWADASAAVQAIRATVYPGQRLAEVGGDTEPWFLLKGWLTPWLMAAPSGPFSPVEATFLWLWLPVAVALLARRWVHWNTPVGDKGHSGMGGSDARLMTGVLLAYAVFVLIFMHAGLPAAVARWSLWGHSTSYRQDLGLGLAQTFVLAAWLRWIGWAQPTSGHSVGSLEMALSVLGLAVVAVVTWGMYSRLPLHPSLSWPPMYGLLLSAAAAGLCACLMWGKAKVLVLFYAGWMGLSGVPFNPVTLAPTHVSPDPGLAQVAVATQGAVGPKRFAVAGPRSWDVWLPAAGWPVAHAVFYYPSSSLWARLDPSQQHRLVHNRYHRLLIEAESAPHGPSYRMETPRLDEVRLWVDPARFDFTLLGAQGVLKAGNAGGGWAGLAENPLLEVGPGTARWQLYQQRPGP